MVATSVPEARKSRRSAWTSPGGLAEPDHETGFGQDAGRVPPGEGEDLEGLAVIGLRAHAAVEPRYGLHVVVENMGSGIQHAGHSIVIAAEVRRQDFHAGAGEGCPDLAYRFGEMMRPAIFEVVTVDAGDDHVLQLHFGGHARYVGGLRRIKPHVVLRGVGFGNGAKAATAGTPVPQDHERGGAAVEALVDVRTARRLADSMQVELTQPAL